MALGTGLTVAALATLAVSARGAALALAGSGGTVFAYRLARGVEILGAGLILVFGLSLLGGALATGLPG
jgi:nickel/cobalt exporter